MRTLSVRATCSTLFSAALLGAPPASAAPAPPEPVTLAQGTVSGTSLGGGVSAYRGIPYGAAGRWESPRPAAGWSGVRNGTKAGPSCAQRLKGQTLAQATETEDCLGLSITRPPAPAGGGALPVLVYLHGGGFVAGRGESQVPGRLAAAARAIVVTVNYRLGVFGFFAHPGTMAGAGTVNFGLQDQQLALRWVKANVAAFGGDPARVTLFGQSAGAISTCLHLTSPGARGLFSAAIAMSGGCGGSLTQPSTARMQAESLALARKLGCPDGPAQLACLRGTPVRELSRATMWDVDVLEPKVATAFLPAVDGTVIPEQPMAALRRGEFARVPFANGSTRDEGRLMMTGLFHWKYLRRVTAADLRGALHNQADGVPEHAAGLVAAYAVPANYRDRDQAMAAMVTDRSACGLAIEREVISQFVPAWGYEFAGTVPGADIIDGWWGLRVNAFHGSDLTYLFQEPLSDLPLPLLLSASERRVAQSMGRAWGSMASRGTPAASTEPAWPPITAAGAPVRNFKPRASTPLTGAAFAAYHHCDAWQPVLAREQALRGAG